MEDTVVISSVCNVHYYSICLKCKMQMSVAMFICVLNDHELWMFVRNYVMIRKVSVASKSFWPFVLGVGKLQERTNTKASLELAENSEPFQQLVTYTIVFA